MIDALNPWGADAGPYSSNGGIRPFPWGASGGFDVGLGIIVLLSTICTPPSEFRILSVH